MKRFGGKKNEHGCVRPFAFAIACHNYIYLPCCIPIFNSQGERNLDNPRNCIDHPSESRKVTNMVSVVVEAMMCWQKKNRHTQIRNPVTLHCHNQITTFLSSTMPHSSNKLKRQLATLFSAVEGSPALLDLLQNATSPAIKIIFINSLLETLPTAFDPYIKEPKDLFLLFTAWFGRDDQYKVIYPRVHAALQERLMFFFHLRDDKRDFIRDIGLDWTAADRSRYISKVNSAVMLLGSPAHIVKYCFVLSKTDMDFIL